MYLTAQPQWSRVVSDAPRLGADAARAWTCPMRSSRSPPSWTCPFVRSRIRIPRLTKRYGEEHRRLMQEYFTEQISKDELIAAEDRLMTSEAEKVIAENDWTCDFQLE